MREKRFPRRLVSGGQTGADRAALDWALGRGLECGGWCPAGRLAEDGRIPDRYPLKETPESAYIVRTEFNVRDSDATVLFSIDPQLAGGSAATRDFCVALKRPFLPLARANCPIDQAAKRLHDFVFRNEVAILNVAGPRASEEPQIGDYVAAVLDLAFPAPFPT